MTLRNKKESIAGIELCKNSCIICGWHKTNKSNNLLVEGAHVKPLENDITADNRYNIIALCPNHHTMFDNYLFYLDPNTLKVIFLDKKDEYNNIDVSKKVKHIRPEYLAYRKYLFDKNNKKGRL